MTGPSGTLDRAELTRHLDGLTSRTDDGVLVLADWLQQQGHPWGELIALQHRGLEAEAAKHLEAHPEILGALAGVPHSRFDWERGLLRRAMVGCNAEVAAITSALERLFAEPIASLLDTVVLNAYRAEFPTWRDWGQSESEIVDPWADLTTIAAAIPPRISRIGLGGWPAPAAACYVAMPSFDQVTAVLGRRLTALELTGWAKDTHGALVLPHVTELAVRFARANEACLQALGRSELPKLERFAIWLGGTSHVTIDDVHPPLERSEVQKGESRYPATFDAGDLESMDPSSGGIDGEAYSDDLQIMLEAAWGRGIQHLEIGSPEWTPELLDGIAYEDFQKQLPALKSLTLTGGTLEEIDIANLTREQFAHLESFQINCAISAKALPKLTATFPDLALRTGGDLEDFHFRYVATVE